MNTIQTARAVREATVRIKAWGVVVFGKVADVAPPVVLDRGETATDWAVAVELHRHPTESPQQAAIRLARYVELHADRYPDTPQLRRPPRHLGVVHPNRSTS